MMNDDIVHRPNPNQDDIFLGKPDNARPHSVGATTELDMPLPQLFWIVASIKICLHLQNTIKLVTENIGNHLFVLLSVKKKRINKS